MDRVHEHAALRRHRGRAAAGALRAMQGPHGFLTHVGQNDH